MAKINSLVVLVALGTMPSLCVYGAEHAVPCNTLPPAVLAQGNSLLNGGTLMGCVKDVSKGKTTYEMEMMIGGRSKDVTLDPSGAVLEVEEQTELLALPAPVQASIQKAANGGQVGKVESLTRGGVIVSYETTITVGGKRREVAFRPDGTKVAAD